MNQEFNSTHGPSKPEPQSSAPLGHSTTTPPTDKNKKRLITLVAGGVALLAIITLAILYVTVWSKPSQADFEAADDVMSSVRENYDEAGEEFAALSSAATAPRYTSMSRAESEDDSRADFDKAIDAYKADVEELEAMKALRDPEVREAYDAFIEKNEEFISYTDGLADDLAGFGEVVENCSSQSIGQIRTNSSDPQATVDAYEKAMQPCMDAVESLQDSSSDAVKDFAETVSTSLSAIRDGLQELVGAAENNDRSAALSVQSDVRRATLDIQTAGSSFSRELRDEMEDKMVKDELEELEDIISEKAGTSSDRQNDRSRTEKSA